MVTMLTCLSACSITLFSSKVGVRVLGVLYRQHFPLAKKYSSSLLVNITIQKKTKKKKKKKN